MKTQKTSSLIGILGVSAIMSLPASYGWSGDAPGAGEPKQDTFYSVSQPETTPRNIQLNNDGVRALKENNFLLAIEKLTDSLSLDPNYKMAKENLAIAYNDYGLSLRKSPKDAIRYFRKACLLSPTNATSKANLEGIIRQMGKDSSSADDRVALGDEAAVESDFEGAMVEYSAALQLRADASTHEKLADVYAPRQMPEKAVEEYKAALRLNKSSATAKNSGQQEGNASAASTAAESSSPRVSERALTAWKDAKVESGKFETVCVDFALSPEGKLVKGHQAPDVSNSCCNDATDNKALAIINASEPFDFFDSALPKTRYRAIFNIPAKTLKIDVRPDVDFARYMEVLNLKIKSSWKPPKGRDTVRLQVQFKLLRDGSFRDVKVSKSSGVDECDKSGLDAVRAAAPFASLPDNAPDPEVQFTFDYNVKKTPPPAEASVPTAKPASAQTTTAAPKAAPKSAPASVGARKGKY